MRLGIDEDAEMLTDGDKLRLAEHALVTILDDLEVTRRNLDEVILDEMIDICKIKLHISSHKFRFNLKTRKPITQD